MEVNQRLIPIFLLEAEVNLGILSDYFLRCTQLSHTREDLKAAYRAAHTIKGTSQLVHFKGINQIALHLEKILEQHYLLSSEITHSELHVLQQTVKLLANVVAAVKKSEPEPQDIVDKALTLLDQMTAASALNDQETQLQEYPDEYPDPVLLKVHAAARQPANDPFAEDEAYNLDFSFGSGLDSGEVDRVVAGKSLQFIAADPFADDPDLPAFSEHSLIADPVPESEHHGLLIDPLSPANQKHLDLLLPPDDYDIGLDHGDDFIPKTTPATELPIPLNLPKRDVEPRRDYVCCTFALCGRKYHLTIGYMVEISDSGPLLPLPLAPAHIKGLVNLRGQVMPVVDMSVFHPSEEAIGESCRLVVARNKDEKIAFLAEGIPYLSEKRIGEEIDLSSFIDKHRLKGLSA